MDPQVIAGELAIGVALMLGIATRFTVFAGIGLFLPLYLVHLPPVDGRVSSHIVYMLALGVLGAGRAGTIYGIYGLLEGLERRWPLLRYLPG